MIQHVGLEVAAASLDDEVAFWGLLGFAEVAPPDASLAARSRWVEGPGGFQVHLLAVEQPAVPGSGHVAVVAAAYDDVLAGSRAAGHEAAPREEYWGAPRTQVVSPAGHRVEVMAAAPPRAGTTPAGVHETVLYAGNLAETAAFYAEVVGLRLVVGPTDTLAALRVTPDSVLLLFAPDESALPGRAVPSHGTRGEGHVAFSVDEPALAAILERCAGAGVGIDTELTWPRGGRSVYVRDPARNSVEFIVGPIWPD